MGEATLIADYKGAFVASGSSFDLVVGALWRTMDRYEKYVKTLEDLHQLRLTPIEEICLELDGDVAVIDFPTEVHDLEYFVGALFNAKEPFRLCAVPRKVADDEWETNAVDLHVGQTLRVEISPHWLRVLLDQRTCGNTLARLVTNLQHQVPRANATRATSRYRVALGNRTDCASDDRPAPLPNRRQSSYDPSLTRGGV